MTDNVENAIFEILKRIQGDIAGLKADVADLKTDMVDVKARLDRLETAMKRQRRDSAAMIVMFRGVVGEFNERIGNIEEEIRILRDSD